MQWQLLTGLLSNSIVECDTFTIQEIFYLTETWLVSLTLLFHSPTWKIYVLLKPWDKHTSAYWAELSYLTEITQTAFTGICSARIRTDPGEKNRKPGIKSRCYIWIWLINSVNQSHLQNTWVINSCRKFPKFTNRCQQTLNLIGLEACCIARRIFWAKEASGGTHNRARWEIKNQN